MKIYAGMLQRLVQIATFVVAMTSSALAQTAPGAIEGRVLNTASGQYLQGAIVRLIGFESRTSTSRDGSFTFRGVPAGEYEIEASYYGLDPRRQPVVVKAGETVVANVTLGSDAVQLDAVRVEADVLGQARAINQQRVAEAMVNITSEELFGEVSDNNIAKALQRIPGISVNSDGGTEIPRYVNIRGFDASLNSVQLNGVRLPTSNDGTSDISAPARGFALDDLPANAVTNIEIVKAPTPDMDGDVVGGIVNLVTKSAFDREGRSIDFKAGVDYIKLRDKFVPSFEVGYSDLLLDGRLGVRFDASYYKIDEGFDNIDYDWLPLGPSQPHNVRLNLPGQVFFHEDTEYNNYFIERDRYGFAASIDYKLSENSRIYFKPVYNFEERAENDIRFHKIMDNDHGRAASAPPAGTPIGGLYVGARGNAIAISATEGLYSTYESVSYGAGRTTLLPNGTGRGSAGYRQALNNFDIEFYSLDFGGEHNLDWGDITWNLSTSASSRDEERYLVRWDRAGLQWAYEREDIMRPNYYNIGGTNAYSVPTRGSADYFTNPSSSNMNSNPRRTEETASQAKIDVSLPFFEGTGIKGTFRTGAKVRMMEREHDRNFLYYRLANSGTYDFASYLQESEHTVSGFEMPYHPDANRVIGEALSGNPLYLRDTSNARRTPNLASDYEASEDSFESYVMGVFDVGPKLRLIPGVRIEHTKFEAKTPVYDATNAPLADRAPQMESRDNDYTQVLPGVHARYEARNNIVFRAAYTNTYGRPKFREMIAVTTFDEANNVLTTGNPDLDPFTSENWDFSVEYFGKRAAYLQLALFHKKVKGQVLELGTTLTGASEFRGLPLNPSETYTVTTFSNQHDSTNRGVELAFRYRFVTLPAPFDGLYFDGSTTYTDSNGNYADRAGEDLPTYGGSEWLHFAGIGYQKDRLAVLLSWRFRSAYLEGLENIDRQNRAFGLASDVGDDWWGEEEFVNLETSYRVTKNFRAYCNISNLLENTNGSFQAPREFGYPEDSYWHRMRIAFGVKGNF